MRTEAHFEAVFLLLFMSGMAELIILSTKLDYCIDKGMIIVYI